MRSVAGTGSSTDATTKKPIINAKIEDHNFLITDSFNAKVVRIKQ